MLIMLLSQNTYFSVPGGYPFALGGVGESIVEGTIAPNNTSVSAVVKADSVANVHLALYAVPQPGSIYDGALVAQSDIIGLTSVEQTVTVSVPTGLVPACYIARLWVDGVTATQADSDARSSGATYSISQNPGIPLGITVSSVVVA